MARNNWYKFMGTTILMHSILFVKYYNVQYRQNQFIWYVEPLLWIWYNLDFIHAGLGIHIQISNSECGSFKQLSKIFICMSYKFILYPNSGCGKQIEQNKSLFWYVHNVFVQISWIYISLRDLDDRLEDRFIISNVNTANKIRKHENRISNSQQSNLTWFAQY